ncbi:hypothetical protein [Bacillus sp. RAR_GA_16]|uniref:hypothetical protein n=1 Tax=Bacillus sp. RAR_GA_16 TaxID=2876774 RepID=UPI001CD00696|nr:hypothetical protein [Bacillus sp. RAR_GA_16]MCA0171079.1 hypothetical protein [Bacillus sp. RAR_GA_16]
MFQLNIVFGVEMKPPVDKLPGFIAQLVKKTAEIAKVLDRDKQLVILSTEEEANALQNYYQSKDVLEGFYPLIHLSPSSALKPSFTDYGFISQNNESYLYKEMVASFMIQKGDNQQREMALLQMEEHLICKDENLFFIDRMHIELMEGIARAYNIELTFWSE